MDLWNNQQGRRIADQIKKEYGKSFYKFSESRQNDIIAEKVMQKMRKGELITHPSDKRKYKDIMTGLAADIENARLKTYSDEKGNRAIYLDNNDDITPEFLEKLDTKNSLIHNKEFNLGVVEDQKILDRAISQYHNDEKYTKEELDRSVKSGGLVYVESYTRSDGTKIEGYYRRR